MPKIGIVTDSTTDMPPAFYAEHGIKVVPLYVRFRDEVLKDWAEISPNEFYVRMRSVTELPKTSQPSVEDFSAAYREFEGYDGVVSIHLSAKLSGTVQSAQIAAEKSPVPVAVIDGRQASIATAFVIQGVLKARDEGKELNEIEALAERLTNDVKIAFYVDTLKYLEMGGRMGKAKYLAASLLKIRPVLTLVNGEVTPYKTVKGRGKVMEEMADFVKSRSGGQLVHIGYVHTDCPETINEMKEAVSKTGVPIASETISQIGCVIGTYIGPGGFALVVRPA